MNAPLVQARRPLFMRDDAVLERLEPLIGADPREILDRFAAAGGKIAELKNREARITGLLAAYRAQFTGGMTHYEHERGQILASIVERRRREILDAGEKPVETALDSYARATDEYRQWLDQKFVERREMFNLEAELAQVHADLEAARLERDEARQELRIAEEAMRLVRAEMGVA